MGWRYLAETHTFIRLNDDCESVHRATNNSSLSSLSKHVPAEELVQKINPCEIMFLVQWLVILEDEKEV